MFSLSRRFSFALVALLPCSLAAGAEPDGVYAKLTQLPNTRFVASVCERRDHFFVACDVVGRQEGYTAHEIQNLVTCSKSVEDTQFEYHLLGAIAGGLIAAAPFHVTSTKGVYAMMRSYRGPRGLDRADRVVGALFGVIHPRTAAALGVGAGGGVLVGEMLSPAHGVDRKDIGAIATGEVRTDISRADLKSEISTTLAHAGAACPVADTHGAMSASRDLKAMVSEAQAGAQAPAQVPGPASPAAANAGRAGDN